MKTLTKPLKRFCFTLQFKNGGGKIRVLILITKKMEGEGYKVSNEEIAEIEKSRTLSDAELLKDGAEYKINDEGEKRLEISNEQLESIKKNKSTGVLELTNNNAKNERDLDEVDIHIKDAEDRLGVLKQELAELTTLILDRSRDEHVLYRQYQATEKNKSRSIFDKILGRNKSTELSVAQESAEEDDKRIARVKASPNLYSNADFGLTDKSTLVKSKEYTSLLEKIDKAEQDFNSALSIKGISDPLKAKLMAEAEHSYQTAAIELDKLGFSERAEQLRKQSHTESIKASEHYENIESPMKEEVKALFESLIEEAVVKSGTTVWIQSPFGSYGSTHRLMSIYSKFVVFNKDDRNRAKKEKSFFDESMMMLYDMLNLDFNKSGVKLGAYEATLSSSTKLSKQENTYIVNNDDFILEEDYGDIKDSTTHEPSPFNVRIDIKKIKK